MRVVFYIDNTYQVVEDSENWRVLYQGSLADCEAYIRLSEGGYL